MQVDMFQFKAPLYLSLYWRSILTVCCVNFYSLWPDMAESPLKAGLLKIREWIDWCINGSWPLSAQWNAFIFHLPGNRMHSESVSTLSWQHHRENYRRFFNTEHTTRWFTVHTHHYMDTKSFISLLSHLEKHEIFYNHKVICNHQ